MTGYVDFAEYYDFDHIVTVDIPFYLEIASQCQPPFLELACGTGRLLIPLAQAGFEVYGLDISANMLAVCRQAVQQHHLTKQIHLHLADMVSFDLPNKHFGLVIIALRSFMHLLTQSEQRGCLQRTYEHLCSGGYFLLNVIAPDPHKLTQPPSEVFVTRREFDLPNGHHVVRQERLVEHNTVTQVRHFEFKFTEYDRAGELVRERRIPLRMRYLFRSELQELLETIGFQIIDTFRDYNRNPYDGTGETIVLARRP